MGRASRINLSAGCTTGVGSLPFTDAREAIAFVAEHSPELPFWPQLPRRCAGEGVVGQGLGTLIEYLEPSVRPYCWQVRPGREKAFADALDGSDAGLSPETAAGFFALERAVQAGTFSSAKGLKAQIEGPATLGHCLFLEDTPLSRIPGWIERLAGFLERQAAWQIRRLKLQGLPVVFVVDEPALSLALVGDAIPGVSSHASVVRRVVEAARREGAVTGVHCCAPLPIELLALLDLEFLSFDATLPIDEPAFVKLAQSIVARGGYLAFGLAPTGPRDMSVKAIEARWLELTSSIGPPSVLAASSLITATCGLGLSSPRQATNSFELCQQAGSSLRARR